MIAGAVTTSVVGGSPTKPPTTASGQSTAPVAPARSCTVGLTASSGTSGSWKPSAPPSSVAGSRVASVPSSSWATSVSASAPVS